MEELKHVCLCQTAKRALENQQMISALIAQPPPAKTKRTRSKTSAFVPQNELKPSSSPTAPTIVPITETVQPSRTDDYNEERDILFLVSMMLLVLVVPAVLMLTYIIFNPEAFMYDITPKYDFSSWQLGEPLKSMK